MNSFAIIVLFLTILVSYISASSIFDDIKGELTLESVQNFDFSTLRPDSFLVYGLCRRVPVPVIEYVLNNQLADVNSIDKDGKNALYYAATASDSNAVKTLIKYGTTSYSAAMNATARLNRSDVFEILLEHYKTEISGGSYERLLSFAAHFGSFDVAHLLLHTCELKKI